MKLEPKQDRQTDKHTQTDATEDVTIIIPFRIRGW